MLDEMEKYREQIDRHYARRSKTDRRRGTHRQARFFDPLLASILAVFIAIAAWFGFTK